jgi:hypothetical protein
MKFRPLDRVDSEFNEGWRFGVACGAAAILVGLLAVLLGILLGVIHG